MQFAAPLVAALVLATVHAAAPALRFLSGTPRSRWLSISGGVSVAYVFVHLLPELAEGQERIGEALEARTGALDHHVYVMALIGLAVFYGLDRLALTTKKRGGDGSGDGVFWIHIGSFAVYNLVIGYLLVHREVPGLDSMILFAVAMGLHFLVTDYGLRLHHPDSYRRLGRWLLAAALLGGWGLGAAIEISRVAIAVLIAFLAGGVILNVLKEELPEERESRYSAFLLGAGLYAALLIAL